MPNKVILRRADSSPNGGVHPALRHPVFAWLGLRPIWGQHTTAEHAVLKKWASGRSRLVEIGVAEGASALGLREAMSCDGTLWLIDPFHLSRVRPVNAMKRAAHRALESCSNGRVVWIGEFSSQAVRDWTGEIDFLFIDGDHAEDAVRQDWEGWHRFVVPGGLVVFHDARVFARGWVTPQYGPLKIVDALFRAQTLSGWAIVEEVDSLVAVQRKL